MKAKIFLLGLGTGLIRAMINGLGLEGVKEAFIGRCRGSPPCSSSMRLGPWLQGLRDIRVRHIV